MDDTREKKVESKIDLILKILLETSGVNTETIKNIDIINYEVCGEQAGPEGELAEKESAPDGSLNLILRLSRSIRDQAVEINDTSKKILLDVRPNS